MNTLVAIFSDKERCAPIDAWLQAKYPDRWAFGGTWMVANKSGDWMNGIRYNISVPEIKDADAIMLKMMWQNIIAVEDGRANILWSTDRYRKVTREG